MPFFKRKTLHEIAIFYVAIINLSRLSVGVIDGEFRNTKAEYKD